MYPRGRANGRPISNRGRGRGQQNNTARYIAPQENKQNFENQRQSRREFIEQQNQQRNINYNRYYRNASSQRQNDTNNFQQRRNYSQGPPVQRSRSASNFNRKVSTFQITERTASKKIVIPKFDKNQKMVHTCSTIGFEMDLFISNPASDRSNYTMLSFTTMAFFFGNYAPIDGKTLVPAKRKNIPKRNMHEIVDHTMQQIVEQFQTLPRLSTEEENFSERMCTLFEVYSDWCNHHLCNGDNFHKIHDVTKNSKWHEKYGKPKSQTSTTSQDAVEQ